LNVSQPLTMASLRGKMVLLDFWTLGCINCQHIIPDLERLEQEFPDSLAIVGVHSGKYSTEHDNASIEEAIRRFGIMHAVVNDPDFAVWNTFGARAWPTLVLIDPAGNLVGGHAGEGVYDLFQPILESLESEFAEKIARTPLPLDLEGITTSTVLAYPSKVLADVAGGRLFIADTGHNRVLVATLDGRLQQAIGSGERGFADGGATEAAFDQPQGMALSDDGATLYVADTRNHAVRSIELASGRVSTIAGTGKQAERMPADNASAATTALASPWDLLVDGDTLYIAIAGVHQLWAMDLEHGTISVFAGTSREGIDNGHRRTMATLAQPSGLATDGTHLYWVDPESSAVRRVALGGDAVETLAGTGLFDFGDRDGPASQALLQHPQGIAEASGKLYIADTYNHKIRVLDPAARTVTTAAGTGERGWVDGPAGGARLDEPGGVSGAGNLLFIADTNNHLVRVLDLETATLSTLQLSNLAGVSRGGPGRVVSQELPAAAAAPGAGTIRVAIVAPDGYLLNSQAPSQLVLESSNPAVLEPGERELTWSTDEQRVALTVPARLGPGSATLTARGAIYYCRKGEAALCFIHNVELSQAVTVAEASAGAEVPFTYTLPTSDGP
jgi:DNA-binding beta-propeller fold protein YncE